MKGKRGRPVGHKLSDGTKDRISKSMTGHKCSKEHKKKTSKSLKKFYQEHPEAMKGKTLSEEHRRKISEAHTTHGKSLTPIWNKWQVIKQRCNNLNNKAYKYYGAKNIKMCDEWENDFTTFHNWCLDNKWEIGLHIHRISKYEDYSPENCIILDRSTHMKLHKGLRNRLASGEAKISRIIRTHCFKEDAYDR